MYYYMRMFAKETRLLMLQSFGLLEMVLKWFDYFNSL